MDKTVQGKERIKFGDETTFKGINKDGLSGRWQKCQFCGVNFGEYHKLTCSTEECPICKTLLIECSCPQYEGRREKNKAFIKKQLMLYADAEKAAKKKFKPLDFALDSAIVIKSKIESLKNIDITVIAIPCDDISITYLQYFKSSPNGEIMEFIGETSLDGEYDEAKALENAFSNYYKSIYDWAGIEDRSEVAGTQNTDSSVLDVIAVFPEMEFGGEHKQMIVFALFSENTDGDGKYDTKINFWMGEVGCGCQDVVHMMEISIKMEGEKNKLAMLNTTCHLINENLNAFYQTCIKHYNYVEEQNMIRAENNK